MKVWAVEASESGSSTLDVVVPEAGLDLSLVLPVFEEEDSLCELFAQLRIVLESLDATWEIIFVDDGSRDNTFKKLESLFASDNRLEIICLRRNFGKTAALLAGFQAARGEIVITLDADLQDDPAELPRFLEELRNGKDLVSGWKRVRHDPWTKTIPSRAFNLTVSKVTGIPLHDFNCGYKAYRREVLEDLKLYGELHRFIPVLAYWKGYRIGEIEVQHRPRRYGHTKFGAGRLVKGMLDFIKVLFLTRYLQRPLQLFGLLGMLLWSVGSIGFLYLLALKISGQTIFQSHGPLLFLSGILIIAGIQLFMLGLVGEMLRHYSFRPHEEYSVKQRLSRP